jgi:hypothetical protein
MIKAWRFRSYCRQKQYDSQSGAEQPKAETPVSKRLSDNIEYIQKTLGGSGDVKIHPFAFNNGQDAALVFIDGLADAKDITQSILKPLLACAFTEGKPNTMKDLAKKALCSGDTVTGSGMDALLHSCLCGDTLLLADGFRRGSPSARKAFKRAA